MDDTHLRQITSSTLTRLKQRLLVLNSIFLISFINTILKKKLCTTDGFPFLITTTASLANVNATFSSTQPSLDPLSDLNFRPNIVLEGLPSDPSSVDASDAAYDEETWKVIRVRPSNTSKTPNPPSNDKDHEIQQKDGELTFYMASRCTRCSVPSNNPSTGEPDPRIQKRLMGFRRVDPGAKYEACFGMNSVCASSGGVVSVGDEVDVIERTLEHDRKVGVWNQ
jgi:uncharacterized protein